jgi:ribosomal 50S subunit-recycling heat shock protein
MMRVDKFLKTSRLVKRRTVAKEVCDQGRVKLNQRPCKASAEVAVGDELTIRFGQKEVTVRIAQLRESVKKEEATELYEVINEVII